MLPNRLLKGCGALSLSLSLLAGCASPVTPTPTETTPVVVAENPPAAQPAAPAAPAAVAPTTLDGKVIFKGQPVAGYAVTVYDARTNLPLERKADLSGVTGLAVLDQNLTTDDQGGFKLQVIGLAPGQALRVVATKGKTSLEAIVSSDLQTLGAKQRRVLATDVTLTLSELTTAMAKIARNVVLTTQVLTPEAAAPVLAKLMADLEALSTKLDEQLKQMPAMADELVQAESTDAIGKAEASALNVLINNAGLLKEATKVVAELVAEIAKQSKDPASRSTAAADPKLVEALAKVEYVGTVLTGALDGTDGTFSLVNGVTGGKIDASTGIGTIADRVTPNRRSDRAPTPDPSVAFVGTDVELLAAIADPSKTTINMTADITAVSISTTHPITIDGGANQYNLTTLAPVIPISEITLKNLQLHVPVIILQAGPNNLTADNVTFSGITQILMYSSSSATLEDCVFQQMSASPIIQNNGGALSVSSCTFSASPLYMQTAIAQPVGPNPTITGCHFNGFQIGIDTNVPAGVAPLSGIQNNTFTTTLPIAVGIYYQGLQDPTLETTLKNQQISFNGYVENKKVSNSL